LAFPGAPLGAVGWGDSVRGAIFRGVNPFIPIDVAQFDLEMSLLFVNPPVIPEGLKQAVVRDYVERNRHYQQVWSVIGFYDRLLTTRRIWTRLPTLILWGQADAIFPAAGAKPLHRHFPRGQRVILPRVGHLPQVEDPDVTASIYLDFPRRHGKGARP
jgi:pimeloyl-ACP methyl ester carboxylesterase